MEKEVCVCSCVCVCVRVRGGVDREWLHIMPLDIEAK